MAFDPKNYHPEWKSIARQIRDQAGNKCEFCDRPNGQSGCYSATTYDASGKPLWISEAVYWDYDGMVDIEGDDWFFEHWPETGRAEQFTKIVLTVHHRCDCDKRVCHDPAHLVALCQRCHLNEDRPHHLAVQQANRMAKQIAKPLPLFEVRS